MQIDKGLFRNKSTITDGRHVLLNFDILPNDFHLIILSVDILSHLVSLNVEFSVCSC